MQEDYVKENHYFASSELSDAGCVVYSVQIEMKLSKLKSITLLNKDMENFF